MKILIVSWRALPGFALLAFVAACAKPAGEPRPADVYSTVAADLRARLGSRAAPMLVPDTIPWPGRAERLRSGLSLSDLENATGFGIARTDAAGPRTPEVWVDFGPLESMEGGRWRVPTRLLVPYPGLDDRRMLDELTWEVSLDCTPRPADCAVSGVREEHQAEWEIVEVESEP